MSHFRVSKDFDDVYKDVGVHGKHIARMVVRGGHFHSKYKLIRELERGIKAGQVEFIFGSLNLAYYFR